MEIEKGIYTAKLKDLGAKKDAKTNYCWKLEDE